MSYDFTVSQSGDDERQARELSLRHTRPPTQIPGYDLTRFLGSGAYGEVWIGLDRNTGRQVAVKFYQHRGGVDWTLLSREVEKLVLLSTDRYVVQLLDVGWEADPPYYVMEYIESGSLEQLIQKNDGRTVEQIVELFREIVIGLNHAHAKGILHCDLKPANVLLDQDAKPRLADFGQSRLTHEQTPSLGTLFYMAPEQADLKAVDGEVHQRLTGVSNELILENLGKLAATDVPFEVRVPVIPGHNDGPEELSRMAEFLAGLSRLPVVELLAYHRLGEDKFGRLGLAYPLMGLDAPDEATMRERVGAFTRRGLRVRYRDVEYAGDGTSVKGAAE